MIPVPDPAPVLVPVPVLDQNWSLSLVLVPVPSYFWSRPWSLSRSLHISGPGLGPGPGPGQKCWSGHRILSLSHITNFTKQSRSSAFSSEVSSLVYRMDAKLILICRHKRFHIVKDFLGLLPSFTTLLISSC